MPTLSLNSLYGFKCRSYGASPIVLIVWNGVILARPMCRTCGAYFGKRRAHIHDICDRHVHMGHVHVNDICYAYVGMWRVHAGRHMLRVCQHGACICGTTHVAHMFHELAWGVYMSHHISHTCRASWHGACTRGTYVAPASVWSICCASWHLTCTGGATHVVHLLSQLAWAVYMWTVGASKHTPLVIVSCCCVPR